MDVYDSMFSTSCVLNEQIARQIFEILPDGVIVAIIDKEGHSWPSDSEKFSLLNLHESQLKELCSRIDDGAEPVVTQIKDYCIIASQLTTERTNCGYIIAALPNCSAEADFVSPHLIELLLSQFELIARLVEKNSLLYELQMKQFGTYGQDKIATN